MTDSRDEHETYAHTESPIIPRLQEQIARLTAERDEARRALCRVESAARTVTVEEWVRHDDDSIGFLPVEPERVAKERNWDCFKEDGK